MIHLALIAAVATSFWGWIRLDRLCALAEAAPDGSRRQRVLRVQIVAVAGWWAVGAGLSLMLAGTTGASVAVLVGAILIAYAVTVRIAAEHGRAL